MLSWIGENFLFLIIVVLILASWFIWDVIKEMRKPNHNRDWEGEAKREKEARDWYRYNQDLSASFWWRRVVGDEAY